MTKKRSTTARAVAAVLRGITTVMAYPGDSGKSQNYLTQLRRVTIIYLTGKPEDR